MAAQKPDSFVTMLIKAWRAAWRSLFGGRTPPGRTSPGRTSPGRAKRGGPPSGSASKPSSPRSARSQPVLDYTPRTDGQPDPGEVIWTWVPFEEDATQGKDRPVLIIGRQRGALVGLMMTSKDHNRVATAEARYGRFWMDIGTGSWDAKRRPSEVRLDRLLTVRAKDMRREGATLDRRTFVKVLAAAGRVHGWSTPQS